MSEEIPPEFCNENYPRVVVETVGELIEALKKLPEDLLIDQHGDSYGSTLIVYNVSNGPSLTFEPVDD